MLFDATAATKPYAEPVHDLLIAWRPLDPEPPELARFGSKPRAAPPVVGGAGSHVSRKAKPDSIARVQWKPVLNKSFAVGTTVKPLSRLFDELSRSVYVIVAARSIDDARLGRGLAQGSAVAVSTGTLITNCHIVEGRPAIYLATKDGLVPLVVTAAKPRADTCVLTEKNATLSPVTRLRLYESLEIGESVLAIGAPSGFSNTLTEGIISQVRTHEGRRLIQTSAAISSGSSGGGLFDGKGNLIGITSFRIKDAEGLNFAIAVDEYLH
jgi:serine protease Do